MGQELNTSEQRDNRDGVLVSVSSVVSCSLLPSCSFFGRFVSALASSGLSVVRSGPLPPAAAPPAYSKRQPDFNAWPCRLAGHCAPGTARPVLPAPREERRSPLPPGATNLRSVPEREGAWPAPRSLLPAHCPLLPGPSLPPLPARLQDSAWTWARRRAPLMPFSPGRDMKVLLAVAIDPTGRGRCAQTRCVCARRRGYRRVLAAGVWTPRTK